MSARASRRLRLAASFALLALVVALADRDAVWRTLRQVKPGWLVAAMAVASLDRLIINQRWRLLLAGRGVHISLMLAARLQLRAGFLGSFLPTSVGVDAVRMTSLRGLGFPVADVVAATLVDRISLLAGTLLLGAAMIALFAHAMLPGAMTAIVLGLTGSMLVAGSAALHPAVRRFGRETVAARAPLRFRRTIHETAEAVLLYRHRHALLAKLAALTIAAFAVRIWFVELIALAAGVAIPFLQLATVVPILWIVVMLPITIGGLGVQELGYVGLMALVGVPAPVAVSMSLIEHVIARVGSLPGAFLIASPRPARAEPAPC